MVDINITEILERRAERARSYVDNLAASLEAARQRRDTIDAEAQAVRDQIEALNLAASRSIEKVARILRGEIVDIEQSHRALFAKEEEATLTTAAWERSLARAQQNLADIEATVAEYKAGV